MEVFGDVRGFGVWGFEVEGCFFGIRVAVKFPLELHAFGGGGIQVWGH